MQIGPYTLNLKDHTLLMGILNITPDSFHDGGRYTTPESALDQAQKMVHEGAAILDLGAESTREILGKRIATDLDTQEELQRLLPILKLLLTDCQLPISIDTYKAKVASQALQWGAHMINDVWGLQKDPDMARVVAENNAAVVIMHNHIGTDYDQDLVQSVIDFLKRSLDIAISAGISENKIILDPGSGFGKDAVQSCLLLARLEEIKALGFPVLLGTSRKSMIGHILNNAPTEERLYGTLATTALAVTKGVNLLRVHDIKPNYDVIKVTEAILQHTSPKNVWTA